MRAWRPESATVMWVLLGMVGLRLLLAALLPLSPDEAYYWIWSQHLQMGYMDHPFMVALWIRVGTWVFGNTPLGIRFCGVLASLGGSIALYGAACRLWPHCQGVGPRAVYLLNATLIFGLGMVVITPDTPLMFFVAVSLWALSCALSAVSYRRTVAWWGITGIFLGLAGDSKYTAVLLGAGVAGFVITSSRRLWQHGGPWVGALLAGGVVSPVLWWNSQHHWVSVLKQGGRAGAWHPERAVQFLSELLGGQLGLATPIVFVCCASGLWRVRRESTLLLWLSIPAILLFLLHACGDRVQANWPSVLCPVVVLAGARFGSFGKSAAISGVVLTALVCVQAAWRPVPLSAHWDPIFRQTAGWSGLTHHLQQNAQQQGVRVLAVEDYALASILAYQARGEVSVVGEDVRWRYLKELKRESGRNALCVREMRLKPDERRGKNEVVWRTTQSQRVRPYEATRCQSAGAFLP